jgi:hypothetical protein
MGSASQPWKQSDRRADVIQGQDSEQPAHAPAGDARVYRAVSSTDPSVECTLEPTAVAAGLVVAVVDLTVTLGVLILTGLTVSLGVLILTGLTVSLGVLILTGLTDSLGC